MAWEWSRVSKSRKERQAQKAAPEASPSAYVVPSPRGRVGPYVAANHDYADNPESPNYRHSMGGRREWRDKAINGEIMPSGDYPAAGLAPGEWAGYTREDWESSQRNEHLVNGDEGIPLFGYRRYYAALNPYHFRIPDARVQRAPHEYDFRRPFDQQNKLGKRTLDGSHYSAANIGMTANPSESLKGMTAAKRRRTTYRIEPVEWGENAPMSDSGGGGSFGTSYAL